MVIAEAVVTWFGDPDHQAFVDDLRRAGVRLELSEEERPREDGPLAGSTFVLTGTLSMPRAEAERLIVEAGGKVVGSVSAKTSYVVAGKGDPVSLNSSPHGAGRRYSRSAARRTFTAEDLRTAMAGIEYRDTDAFLDEIPAAYKDIDTVMARDDRREIADSTTLVLVA